MSFFLCICQMRGYPDIWEITFYLFFDLMTLLGCLTTATLCSIYLRKFWHYLKDRGGKSFVVTWKGKKQVYLVLCQVLWELLEKFPFSPYLFPFPPSLPLLCLSLCVSMLVCESIYVQVWRSEDSLTFLLGLWRSELRLSGLCWYLLSHLWWTTLTS